MKRGIIKQVLITSCDWGVNFIPRRSLLRAGPAGSRLPSHQVQDHPHGHQTGEHSADGQRAVHQENGCRGDAVAEGWRCTSLRLCRSPPFSFFLSPQHLDQQLFFFFLLMEFDWHVADGERDVSRPRFSPSLFAALDLKHMLHILQKKNTVIAPMGPNSISREFIAFPL